jgi:gentisate 1,2-dioxygenase
MNQLTKITRRFVRNGKHRSVRGAYVMKDGKRVFMRAGDMVGALIAKEAGHLCADGG